MNYTKDEYNGFSASGRYRNLGKWRLWRLFGSSSKRNVRGVCVGAATCLTAECDIILRAVDGPVISANANGDGGIRERAGGRILRRYPMCAGNERNVRGCDTAASDERQMAGRGAISPSRRTAAVDRLLAAANVRRDQRARTRRRTAIVARPHCDDRSARVFYGKPKTIIVGV